MSQILNCPNCKAPVEPDPSKPTMACTYCGYHLKNTFYQPPPSKSPGPRHPVHRQMWLFYVVPIVLAVVGAIPAIIMSNRASQHSVSVNVSTGPVRVSGWPKSRRRTPTPPKKPVDPVRQREMALSYYVGCLDGTYWRVTQSRRRYRSWRKKNPERTPTCRERYVTHGLHEVSGDGCSSSWQQLERKGNAGLAKVDVVAKAYDAALRELGPLTKEGASYFNKKGFLLDDCAKARELHPKLMTAFKKAVAAQAAFRAVLASEIRGTLKRCIQRATKSPELAGTLLWARMIEAAGDTVAALRTQWKAQKPDLQAVKAALAQFNKAVATAEGMSKEQQRASGYDWTHQGDRFAQAGIAFLKSKAGRRFGFSERHQIRWGSDRHHINGTYEKVVQEYNEMLGRMVHMKHCGRLLSCEDDKCPEPR